MALATGLYNIKHSNNNIVWLSDPSDGTPLTATTVQGRRTEKWNVSNLGNGRYKIENQGSTTYASTATGAKPPSPVVGAQAVQQWVISVADADGFRTISASDTEYQWGLANAELDTQVTINDNSSTPRVKWKFVPTS